MKGLVAFSFAQRNKEEEPNPCNARLGRAAEWILDEEEDQVVVVAQWEVARQLHEDNFPVDRVVELGVGNNYLNSERVWAEAKELFKQRGISVVIPVAQPILQIFKVIGMIEADGFTVVEREIGSIGFDKLSTQWWTRGRIRLLLYTVLQTLFGFQGKKGAQQTKNP